MGRWVLGTASFCVCVCLTNSVCIHTGEQSVFLAGGGREGQGRRRSEEGRGVREV